MKHPTYNNKDWFVCGFAFSTDGNHVVLIEKRKAWCDGRLNGVGGSIEVGECPLDAQRREFLEETGLALRNWEYYCTLEEPNAVVEFFRASAPLELLRAAKTMTVEEVILLDLRRNNHGHLMMPNLSWLIPLGQRSCGIVATVEEFSGAPGDDVVQLG